MRQPVDGLAAGRKLEPDAVQALIDQGPFSAGRALKTGLVDQVASSTPSAPSSRVVPMRC